MEATYYFGGPVADAKVTYTVYKSPSYFEYYPEEDSDSEFYEELYRTSEGSDMESEDQQDSESGDVVVEGEGITDAGGVLKIKIPTKRSDKLESYSVSASVTDASGRTIDASGDVMVTPADFALSPRTAAISMSPTARSQRRSMPSRTTVSRSPT